MIKLNDVACSGPESYSICSKWTAYSGFVCDETACYGAGGGHAATMTDTVFKMDFDSFQWTELYPPTPCSVQQDESAINVEHSYIYNYHERPISSHTYDMLALHGGYLYTLGGRGCRRAKIRHVRPHGWARTLLAAYQRLQECGWPGQTHGSL